MIKKTELEKIIKATPADLRGQEITKFKPQAICIDRYITKDKRWLMVWEMWATGADIKVITEKSKII